MTCPGCSATYIGKTERRLQTRLAEHTNPTKSAIGQHFHNCEHVQYIVNLHFAFDKLNNPTDADNNVSTFISNLIIDNSRILHTIYSRRPNFLLLLEALYIKYHSPSLNTGLKASKELKFFLNLYTHISSHLHLTATVVVLIETSIKLSSCLVNLYIRPCVYCNLS